MAVFNPVNATLVAQVPLTPSAVPANSAAEQTFTVTGCPSTSFAVLFRCPAQPAGVTFDDARIIADDTVGLTFTNNTGGSLTPTAGVYTLVLFR